MPFVLNFILFKETAWNTGNCGNIGNFVLSLLASTVWNNGNIGNIGNFRNWFCLLFLIIFSSHKHPGILVIVVTLVTLLCPFFLPQQTVWNNGNISNIGNFHYKKHGVHINQLKSYFIKVILLKTKKNNMNKSWFNKKLWKSAKAKVSFWFLSIFQLFYT